MKRDPASLLGSLAVLLLAFTALSPVTGRTADETETADPEGGRQAPPAEQGLGHHAAKPSDIPPRGWWSIAKRVAGSVSDHRLMAEAAGVTFYTLLALFPALAALVSIYGLFAAPGTISEQLGALSQVVPGGGMQIISDQVHSLTSNGNKALGFALVIGLATSLWSANQAIKAVFDALNVVYDERERRGFFLRTVLTLAFTVGGILFVVIAMGAVVALPVALNFVGLGPESDLAAAHPAVAGAADRDHAHAGADLSLRPEPGARPLAVGHLGWRVRRRGLAARFHRLLLVRDQFRQLQQDIRVTRRGDRFHDLDLDFGNCCADRRRAQRRDGTPDRA